jgi:hypothetical protein
MLAKHVAQVFYVLDTINKKLKVVIPRKRQIIRVENAIDEEEFDQFDDSSFRHLDDQAKNTIGQ